MRAAVASEQLVKALSAGSSDCPAFHVSRSEKPKA